ncbi:MULTISPECIES: hypothetical protein [Klebsiella/Raoultella group]|uniref:hypothetical protein n=1 Tax=Klebsiella/Raoultella group TaxID=2890311 RepID=UPI0010342D1A|nr:MULTISPECIES: hypothetical protein [Klebsiella/Raoultella group]NGX72721.1 hypothetical protein [Klebsiella pneumoniae]UAN12410.1 hypothetical protein KGP19_09325 [Raoultella planticola]HBW9711388.1 hypothetical protein [Klebsiella pneumoniae]HBY0123495.1 hypothetical protein [Klebsiella pneumoniae]
MLKLTLKRGDALHVVFPDGTNGIIEACARCELTMHFPRSAKITRENGAFLNKPNLIKHNQK